MQPERSVATSGKTCGGLAAGVDTLTRVRPGGGRGVRLDELISNTTGMRLARGDAGVRVCDVTEDSRTVVPGSLFIARPGTRDDGRRYAVDAVRAGASVVLTNAEIDSLPAHVAVLLAEDVAAAGADVAERFYGNPSRDLVLVGVTGTNGKTTVAHLTQRILAALGAPTGLISTVCIDDGCEVGPAEMTTPPAVELSRTLAVMRDAGRRAAVMEASSHALDQKRTDGLAFDVAVFTNLTGDHQDYHKTMDAYAAAKRRLFNRLPADGVRVVNIDDPAAESIAGPLAAGVVTCTARGADGATWRVRANVDRPDAPLLEIAGPDVTASARVQLVGAHNSMNTLEAVAAAMAVIDKLGVDRAEAIMRLPHALTLLVPPMGRLEPVHAKTDDVRVFVDFGHTDDALRRTLEAARTLVSPGASLWAVYGAGGEKDRGKRPRMGAVGVQLADRVVLTSDNPRREPPNAIIDELLAGVSAAERAKVLVHADRAVAIETAIAEASPGDVIVIAGKGHERVQEIASADGASIVEIPFVDQQVARDALGRRAGARTIGAA